MKICSFFFAYFLTLILSCYSPTAQFNPTANPSATANLSTTWTTQYSLDQPVPILLTESKPGRRLNFTAAGELVLTDIDGSIAWTANTAGKSVAGMNLTDTGNLVLFDVQNLIVWQSFDHPTDCLLLGQLLYQGKKLRSSVSKTNSSEGMFFVQVTFAYVESNPPQSYYSRSGYLNDNDTHKGKRYVRFLPWKLSLFIHSSEPNDPDDVIIIPYKESAAQYMKLMPDGHLHGNLFLCPIAEYFRPVDNRQPKLGCSEITPLSCSSTQDQHFITLEKVKYFTPANIEEVNVERCKQACLKNCSCKAAFFQYYSGAPIGNCFLASEIFTMEADDSHYNGSAFIKVQNVRSHHLATILGSTIGSFVLLLVVATGFVMYKVHKHKRDAEMEEDYLDQFPGIPNQFSYEELKTATESFSLSHVKKSFLAEVQSIGSIHHVNLVRLRGFCTWKSQRFLVYDFMSNGSLDKWIYHGVREQILEWECIKKIILDIARGLAYLHEERVGNL
ncbi:putative protein kinase RLK-Pelle-SD-2b family [Helianthus annuus]|nr:putative protein kinase RLK-Pelle-SD-2b family [Helianthus annuus]